MESPFANCPYSLVYQAYKNLYNIPCDCYMDYRGNYEKVNKNSSGIEYGQTIFYQDNSVPPSIIIYGDYPMYDQVDTLIHELAHVAVGCEVTSHGKEWKAAYRSITKEYHRLVDEKNKNIK